MAKLYNYDVMFDDTSIDVSKEVGLVWSIANSLRGAYTSDKYKDVIIPIPPLPPKSRCRGSFSVAERFLNPICKTVREGEEEKAQIRTTLL